MYREILRTEDKNSRGQRVIFTINIYRTKSSFLINGPHPKIYSGDTTRDTVMGAGKQNNNRYVRTVVRKDNSGRRQGGEM